MEQAECIYLSDSVLLAMRMAREAAEIQCGRKFVWKYTNIQTEPIRRVTEDMQERTVKLSGLFRCIDELAEFHPQIIECDLVQYIHWMPKEVRITVPVGTTRYIYERVENTNKWDPNGWVIGKVI